MSEQPPIDPKRHEHERQNMMFVADLIAMLHDILAERGVPELAIAHILGAYATASWANHPIDPATMQAVLINALTAVHDHGDLSAE